jgi:hypothetical protein
MEDCLVLPLQDANGEVWSAQLIAPAQRPDWAGGDKSFEKGARTAGCFHLIGKVGQAKQLVVCEGFATGATITEATGLPVACAMSCGNLESVVAGLTERLHSTVIIIAADNDRYTQDNPGLAKARAAAKTYNCPLAVPKFDEESEEWTDFNDLCRIRGAEAVAHAIREAGTLNRPTRDRLGRFTVALPDCISVEMPAFLDSLGRAMLDANQRRGSPRYLCRGDALVLLVGNGRASRLLVANESLIRGEAQRDIMFVRRIREEDGSIKEFVAGALPQQFAKDISRIPTLPMRLPAVDGIAGCPVMDRTGKIYESGYVPSLRVVCACDPWEMDQPTLIEARERLLDLLRDYCFVTPADHSRALASVLQPALVMGEHVERGPAFLVIADQPSTGKGTMVAQRCAMYGATAAGITMRERGGVGSLDEDLST